MIDQPLISIAMCTYNGERFLPAQLASILDQTYRNIELVVFDDHSSDGTVKILQDHVARDSRVKLQVNDVNLGFVRNFQQALMACSGRYIALADQDDIWLPHKIERLASEIGENLLIYSRVEMIDEHENRIAKAFPRVNRIEGNCALSLLLDNCVTGHACLIRKELLDQALPMPADIFAHDQWLAIVAAASGRLKASSEVLSLYRHHGSNAVLQRKGAVKPRKHEKLLNRVDKLVNLIDAVLARSLLDAQDRTLLEEFRRLVVRNRNVFYNSRLAAFLRAHSREFLQLYKKPDKVIRKTARGYWYYRLLLIS